MAVGSNSQLSDGESTLRDDLPEIVATRREAGLASVFLQYDGTEDRVHLKLRVTVDLHPRAFPGRLGRRLLDIDPVRLSPENWFTAGP
jgi:hypothetical protein